MRGLLRLLTRSRPSIASCKVNGRASTSRPGSPTYCIHISRSVSASRSNSKDSETLDSSSKLDTRLAALQTEAAVTQEDTATVKDSFQGEEFTFRVGIDDAPIGKERVRLDAFLSAQLPDASRAKLQASIKDGLVTINGKLQQKTSLQIKLGDVITCKLQPVRRLEADPEDIPLEILFEDEHLLVVNKAAGMVVHPSPGHYTGTLVNALLHHCHLPAMHFMLGSKPPTSLADPAAVDEVDEVPEDEVSEGAFLGALSPVQGAEALVIRPGIVHRLDKGTSGLLVVAKDDFTHARLCDQFKEHSVERSYLSIVVGTPKQEAGMVETNIGRDLKDRKKMAPFGAHSSRGRYAASEYRVLESLAGGRASVMQWRLRTGRTHQIRVHAKYSGNPIFGDDTYAGGASTVVNFIGGKSTPKQLVVRKAVKALGRPALHAKTLGFIHPTTQEKLRFTTELPADFAAVLDQLRELE